MIKFDTEVEFTMCYAHIYIHTYIYIYTVINIYIHTHTHIYTHTHILSLVFITTILGGKILMIIVLITPFYRWKNQATVRFSNFPRCHSWQVDSDSDIYKSSRIYALNLYIPWVGSLQLTEVMWLILGCTTYSKARNTHISWLLVSFFAQHISCLS